MSQILLVLVAAASRFLGAVGDGPRRRNAMLGLLVGALLRAGSIWCLLLATRGVVPLWPVLPGALLLAAISRLSPTRTVTVVADATLLVLLSGLSVPRPSVLTVVLLGIAAAALSYLAEAGARRVESRRHTAAVIVVAIGALAGIGVVWKYWDGIWRQAGPVPWLSASLQNLGERVNLETGAVAWYARPPRAARPTAVLLLHGALPDGSSQPGSVALRAALLAAGYPVLSLDYLGYGATPPPADPLRVDSWDEGPNIAAAIRFLRAEEGYGRVVAVGHSMGCLGAMRSLETRPAAEAAVLFGAAMVQELGREQYWLRRFHTDRGLPEGTIPMEAWQAIHRAHYDGRAIARSLSRDHPPVVLVHYEIEHDDVAQTRDQYLDELGRDVRQELLLGSHHYFNSVGRPPIVLTDWSLVRRLAERLPEWLADTSDGR